MRYLLLGLLLAAADAGADVTQGEPTQELFFRPADAGASSPEPEPMAPLSPTPKVFERGRRKRASSDVYVWVAIGLTLTAMFGWLLTRLRR